MRNGAAAASAIPAPSTHGQRGAAGGSRLASVPSAGREPLGQELVCVLSLGRRRLPRPTVHELDQNRGNALRPGAHGLESIALRRAATTFVVDLLLRHELHDGIALERLAECRHQDLDFGLRHHRER
jgi:hypothetical protein